MNSELPDDVKELKSVCHEYFDKYWQSKIRVPNDRKHCRKVKRKAYARLSTELHIPMKDTHFRCMNTVEELERALNLVKSWM